jgi:hypothetical protein
MEVKDALKNCFAQSKTQTRPVLIGFMTMVDIGYVQHKILQKFNKN